MKLWYQINTNVTMIRMKQEDEMNYDTFMK